MIPCPTPWSHWAHNDDALPSGPRDTSPSYGVTNPSLDPCQPNRHFRRYPRYTFIVTQLRCDVWYTQSTPTVSGSYTISWSKEEILDTCKALAKRTTRSFMLCLGLGLVHHIILLMMWSRYQRHPNVHSQETMTICWSQRAGQLEAYQGHSVV